ncbi:MAG: adenylate/guanylate cyclase domain-containing protein [Anaerolineae bacterium]|nr:adenylate/guanylate cyclase domain-containing protein [Anaerolineae bacterium]
MKLNHAMLQQKLDALAAFPTLTADHVQQFGTIITAASDWDLRRIDPLGFAEAHALDPVATVTLFVHAAKVGLFDFEWNMICPMCGSVEYQHSGLHEIDPQAFHCTMCNIDVSTELDGQIEVTFTVNPGVADLEINPFADLKTYRRYFSSPYYLATRGGDLDAACAMINAFGTVAPDDTARVTFEAAPDTQYRLYSLDKHAAIDLFFTSGVSDVPQVVEVDMLPTGMAPGMVTLPAGRVTVHLRNLGHTLAGLMLMHLDPAMMMAEKAKEPAQPKPFFNGTMLLNNQSFRDLFRIQALPDDLQLKISNLTILFTDLKNSTELYSRTGDMIAYQLVQDHFAALTRAARNHGGAIIKTIGDAVMAAFTTPRDALAAAVEMLREIETLNARTDDPERHLALKVGLHAGSALAVKANEILDYFGQTVNIAARVQGLAEVGEIWITEDVFAAPEVQGILNDAGYATEKQAAMLRGVGESMIVYKCDLRA